MAVEWRVKATEMVNCNCAYGFPCQVNALPPMEIAGRREATRSRKGTSARSGSTVCAPLARSVGRAPLHLGNGTMQVIVDERADAVQRDALIKILSGEETDEMATGWSVFAAMSPTKLTPRFEPIEYEINIAARRGRFRVPGVVETIGKPIRNPITGAEQSVRIDLPHGFEFRTAEMGSGTTKATAAIALPGIENTHIHFANIHLSNKGVVD